MERVNQGTARHISHGYFPRTIVDPNERYERNDPSRPIYTSCISNKPTPD